MRGYGHGWLCLLPGRAFRSAECLEVETLLLKKAIMFLAAGGQLVWVSPRCPWVILGERDWERPCNCIVRGPQSHQKAKQQMTFLVGKLLWRILIGNPLDFMQQHSFGVYCDWSELFPRSKQQLSFTLHGWKSFCGNYILFPLLTWFTVHLCHCGSILQGSVYLDGGSSNRALTGSFKVSRMAPSKRQINIYL